MLRGEVRLSRHPVKQFVRILPLPIAVTIHDMNRPALGEDAEIGIADLAGEQVQFVVSTNRQLGVAERHQLGSEMFWQGAFPHRVMDEPPRFIELANRCATPVNHLGGQDAADA